MTESARERLIADVQATTDALRHTGRISRDYYSSTPLPALLAEGKRLDRQLAALAGRPDKIEKVATLGRRLDALEWELMSRKHLPADRPWLIRIVSGTLGYYNLYGDTLTESERTFLLQRLDWVSTYEGPDIYIAPYSNYADLDWLTALIAEKGDVSVREVVKLLREKLVSADG